MEEEKEKGREEEEEGGKNLFMKKQQLKRKGEGRWEEDKNFFKNVQKFKNLICITMQLTRNIILGI